MDPDEQEDVVDAATQAALTAVANIAWAEARLGLPVGRYTSTRRAGGYRVRVELELVED